MFGVERRRQEAWERALFVAYHAGQFAQADFKKVPPFEQLMQPRQPRSNAEIAEHFAAMARRSNEPELED